MDLILPLVFSPLKFELQLGTIRGHQRVYEVNLNFVDVDNVRLVATRTVKGQIAIDCAIIGRRHF